MSDTLSNDQSNATSNQSEQIELRQQDQPQDAPAAQLEGKGEPQSSNDQNKDQAGAVESGPETSKVEGSQEKVDQQAQETSAISSTQPSVTISSHDAAPQGSLESNSSNSGSSPNPSNNAPTLSSTSGAAPAPTTKKFTSLSVNKRFLEKTSPNVSPTLKSGSASGGSLTSLSNGNSSRSIGSSPATQSRLAAGKPSAGVSASKPNSASWNSNSAVDASSKAKTEDSNPASTPEASSTSASTTTTTSLPAVTSSALSQSSASSASPKLLTSMPNSRARAGGASSGLKNSSSERGRSSPGFRNAALSGATAAGRSGSPGGMNTSSNPHSISGTGHPSSNNVSGSSSAPWASIKSSNQSSNATSSSSQFNPKLLSDFPTAAEVVRAKKIHEERLAHHAAEEAARQERNLQELERFRGTMTHSGSGTHWDELEDGEEDDFLDGVVEFADGTKYEISNIEEQHQQQSSQAQSQDQQQQEQEDQQHIEEEPRVEVTKEERFKDVSHDRSWPPSQSRDSAQQTQKKSIQPSAILPSTTKKATSSSSTSRPPWANANATTSSSSERDPPPHSLSSTLPTSPHDESSSRRLSFGRSSGWDRSGDRGLNDSEDARRMSGSGSRTGLRPFSSAQPQASSSQATAAPAPTSARGWGTLAQRQALLNPDAPKPAPPLSTSASKPSQPQPPAPTTGRSNQPSAPPSRDLPPHALMTSATSNLTSSTSVAQITSPVTAPARPVPTTNPWGNRKHGTAGPPSPTATTGPLASTSDPAATASQTAVAPSSVKSSSSPSTGLKPLQDDPQRGEMLTAAERARRRREEEEKARAAERERARKKAAEIEERMRKEKEEKERIERERLEEEARKRKEEERLRKEESEKAEKARKEMESQKMASAAAAEGEQRKKFVSQGRPKENEVWRRSDVPLAPQSLRNQSRTPSSQAIDEVSARAEQARESSRTGARSSPQLKSQGPSQSASRSPPQVKASISTPSSEATSWRRSGPLPSAASASAQSSQVQPIEPRSQQTAATPAAYSVQDPPAEVQKQILPRHVPRSPTITAPSPTQSRNATSPSSIARPQVAATSPSKNLSNLDDLMLRIKGAMSAQAPASNTPTPDPIASPGAVPTGPASSRLSSTSPMAQTIQIKQRPATGPKEEPRSSEKSQDSPPQIQIQRPTQQVQVQPTRPPARPEPLTTSAEVPMDPPPVWNKFVVKMKKFESATLKSKTKSKSESAKRVRIEVPNAPDVVPVYPLTWDPPINSLSSKTLSRDAQFFPKSFHKGQVIAPVSLPKKDLKKNSVPPRPQPQPIPSSAPLSPSKVFSAASEVSLPTGPRASISKNQQVSIAKSVDSPPLSTSTSTSTSSPMPRVNMPKPAVKLPPPASSPDQAANGTSLRGSGGSTEGSWRQRTTATTSLGPPNSNAPIAPAAMRSTQKSSGSPSPAPASKASAASLNSTSSQRASALSPPVPARAEVRSPFKAAVSAAVSQSFDSTINPTVGSPASGISSSALPNSSKAPGSSRNQQTKGRRESAVAFHPSMGDLGRETPSPVSFMVNSELESSRPEVGVGSSGSSILSGVPVSVSGRSSSANQTPGSTSSVLPSPSSLGGSATWGFPVLDRGTPLLPDSDHLKSVWALSPSGDSSREVPNSLKGIADDFLPSSIPLSVHDLNAEEGPMSAGSQDREVSTAGVNIGASDINGTKSTPSPNHAVPSTRRFDAGTNTDSVLLERQRSQSHSPQQPVGARNGFDSSSMNSPSSPFQQARNNGLPPAASNTMPSGNGNGSGNGTNNPSNSFPAASSTSPSQQFSKTRRSNFNQAPYPYATPNAFVPYPAASPYLSPAAPVAAPIPPPPPPAQPPFGGYSPFAGPAPYSALGAAYSPFGHPQRLPNKPSNPSALGNGQGQANWGSGTGAGTGFGVNPNGNGGMGTQMSNTHGYSQHQSPQLRNSGLNVRSPAFTPSFNQNQAQQQQQQNQNQSQNQSSRQTNAGSNPGNPGRAPPPHMFQQFGGGW